MGDFDSVIRCIDHIAPSDNMSAGHQACLVTLLMGVCISAEIVSTRLGLNSLGSFCGLKQVSIVTIELV